MFPPVKLPLILAAGFSAAAFPCPLCSGGTQLAGAQDVTVATRAPDTAMVRLHISRMTCGSCPTTARLALKQLTGVYSATVTLDDSLGVVRYDPRKANTGGFGLEGIGVTLGEKGEMSSTSSCRRQTPTSTRQAT